MFVFSLLAYAESPDQSDALLVLILQSLGVVAVAAIVALVPLMICNARKLRRPGFLLGASLLWALVAMGDLIYFLFARYQWSGEYQKLVMSGYYDPTNTADAPRPHWLLWLCLAAAYVALLVSAATAKPRPPAAPRPAAPDPSSNGHQSQ